MLGRVSTIIQIDSGSATRLVFAPARLPGLAPDSQLTAADVKVPTHFVTCPTIPRVASAANRARRARSALEPIRCCDVGAYVRPRRHDPLQQPDSNG
jgi:hypothetical protein